MPANSLGWPARPRGVSWPKLFTFSSGMVEGIKGVQIGPGATALTRIPLLPSIWARPAVKLETAPLVEAYARSMGLGLSDWIEVVLMMDDPGSMCGTAALARWNMASMLVRNV